MMRRTSSIIRSAARRAWEGGVRPRIRYTSTSTDIPNTGFFKVEGASGPAVTDFVVGEIVDHSANLKAARPGDVIKVPYELTVTRSLRDFWHSCFYSHDRLNTSTPFARNLGFQDQVLPYSLMLFLTGSMSHADQATVQVAFKNAIYHWPAFGGDTITKRFIIKSVRPSSSQQSCVFTFICELRNQRDMVIFTAEKSMIFPFVLPPSEVDFAVERPPRHLEEHLVARADRKFKRDEIYIPGGLVIGLALSSSGKDLHEVLHEEIVDCAFINHLHPWDLVSSVTYIKDLDENVTGDLEALSIRTIGIKNVDVFGDLKNKPLPLELLTKKGLRTKQVEAICKAHIPHLSKKIVCVVDRRILRQSPKVEAFLL